MSTGDAGILRRLADLSVKQDGLLPRTQVPTGTMLRVGDAIDIEILKIESERGRVGSGCVN